MHSWFMLVPSQLNYQFKISYLKSYTNQVYFSRNDSEIFIFFDNPLFGNPVVTLICPANNLHKLIQKPLL